MPEAEYYLKFLGDAVITFSDALINSYLDEKGRDVSAQIRGRLYQLKDILAIHTQLEDYDKMKQELLALENEGYRATPDEGFDKVN